MGSGTSKQGIILGYTTSSGPESQSRNLALERAVQLVKAYKKLNTTKQENIWDKGRGENIFNQSERAFKSYLTINLTKSGITELSPDIRFWYSTTTLILNENDLSYLPEEIGQMVALKVLEVNGNRLRVFPSSIGNLKNLKNLSAIRNQLKELCHELFLLTNLHRLYLMENNLKSIPPAIGKLKNLLHIDVSDNPLTALPEEISRNQNLRVILANNCPFLNDILPPIPSNIPTLKEMAGRTLIRNRMGISTLPNLNNFLSHSNECSFCDGPYFDYYESRYRFIFRDDRIIPLESKLCKSHYRTDAERIKIMFQPLPNTKPIPYVHQKPRSRNASVSVLAQQTSAIIRSPSLPNLPDSIQLPVGQRLVRRLSSLSSLGFKSRSSSRIPKE